MKYLVVCALSHLISLNVFSQDNIEQTFEEYRLLIEEKNYDEAFSYYHQDLLKYIPKTQLRQQFTALEENESLEHSLKNSKIVFLSEPLTKDSIEYRFIRYKTDLHLKLNPDLSDQQIQKYIRYFKENYGSDCSFVPSQNLIIINKKQELIGIKENEWKFVIYKPKLNSFMHLWVPEDIMTTFFILAINNK